MNTIRTIIYHRLLLLCMEKVRLSVTIDENVMKKLSKIQKKEDRDLSNVVNMKLKEILGVKIK